MKPEFLILMCEELESMIDLQSLSFRKNVLWKNPEVGDFASALTKLVASAPALIHLDFSAMFLGDQETKKVMIDGVYESKTLAAVHLSDNQISHWTRLQIYAKMTTMKERSDLKFYNARDS